MLSIDTKAPAFTLLDQKGEKQTLSQYKDNYVLLYFYPKDMTEGCTKEACGFRDIMKDLKKQKITVLGVSLDDTDSHKKFVKAEKLNFPLLSDVKRKVSEVYGALKIKTDKKGETYSLTRMSYLIDTKGKIVKVYASVNTEKHAAQVLKDVMALKESMVKVPAKVLVKVPAKVTSKTVAKKVVAKKAPAKKNSATIAKIEDPIIVTEEITIIEILD